MPITRKQFDLGIDAELESWMRRMSDFLVQHQEEAFSLDELGGALEAGGWNSLDFDFKPLSSQRQRFELALRRLVDLDVVSERVVAGVHYYAAGRRSLSDVLAA